MSWAANAVLFVAACFLAADTANAVFASMLAAPVASEAPAAAAPERRPAPDWTERQWIVKRNLFNAATADQAETSEEELEDLEETKLPLRLLGTTAAADPVYSWAAVEDEQNRDTLVVTLGDVLLEKAEVLRIERRRIVLREDGEARELSFGDEEPERPPVSRARASAASRRSRRAPAARAARATRNEAVRQLAENRYAVDRSAVERALRDPTDILSQARFLPKYDGSQMVGFEVNAIKRDSVLREFGMQDGDIITEVNGIEISSPADTARLLQEFNASQGPITVSGETRDGEGFERTIETD
ncbi:MAG: type II secretion system protein GspC [Myxococcota bacterium]